MLSNLPHRMRIIMCNAFCILERNKMGRLVEFLEDYSVSEEGVCRERKKSYKQSHILESKSNTCLYNLLKLQDSPFTSRESTSSLVERTVSMTVNIEISRFQLCEAQHVIVKAGDQFFMSPVICVSSFLHMYYKLTLHFFLILLQSYCLHNFHFSFVLRVLSFAWYPPQSFLDQQNQISHRALFY